MTSRCKAILRIAVYVVSTHAVLSCGKPKDVAVTARLHEAGVAEALGTQRQVTDATSATGFISRGGDLKITRQTSIIPARQGTAFGISYQLDGVPRGRSVLIRQVLRHPPMRRPDGSVLQEQISYEQAVGDGGPIQGKYWYLLREGYEVVPGVWTLSLVHDSSVLLTQQFTLNP